MDSVLHDKTVEENKEDDGDSVVETFDQNLFQTKAQPVDEATDGIVHADWNSEQSGLIMLPVCVSQEIPQLPNAEFDSPGPASQSNRIGEECLFTDSYMFQDDEEISAYSKGPRSPLAEYDTHNGKEMTDYVALSNELLDANADEILNNEVETEALYPLTESPLLEFDVKHSSYLADDTNFEIQTDLIDFDHQNENGPVSNEVLNGEYEAAADISNSQKGEFASMETSGRVCSQDAEAKEDSDPTAMLMPDNRRTEGEYSGPRSPLRTRDGAPSERSPRTKHYERRENRLSPTREYSGPRSPPRTRDGAPSPARVLSGSPETSPRTKHYERRENRLSPTREVPSSPCKRRKSYSPEKHGGSRKRASSHNRSSPAKRKRSLSPENLTRGHKALSRDRSSPSLRRRSPTDKLTHSDSHRRGDSPRKHLSTSPRRRDSPRRRERPVSRSPTRRRDSSRNRKDYRGRSRSRSPYSRNTHRRSPRRRHSPRHRSPPSSYHSRRRSPKKAWAPPANRNTGIGKPGNNLFVAGFSYVTTERDLEKKFSRFGRVTDVRVVRERRTGESRGFGFLSFEKDEDADAAIRAIDQTEWNGRIVLVEKSKTPLR